MLRLRLLCGRMLLAALASMMAQSTATAGSAPDPDREASDFARAFDRETNGVFSRLVAHGDAADTLSHYASLVAAWVKIEDAFYEAYSPHANTLPGWYAEQLVAMGLADLDRGTPGAEELLRRELESGDFDRVVHAFYVVSVSRLPLVQGETPTPLWTTMIDVARGDAGNRYWISLALAESKRLPPYAYERMHTRMASPTESVRERIGRNARALGPRLPRVLGVGRNDVNVSHQLIVDALVAAAARVHEHELLALGGPAAYAAVRDELARLETGTFDSRRFLALMNEDLPLLLEHFGLPDDPEAMLETLRMLCRGRGSNRMLLWDAADDLARRYQPLLAARQPAPQKEALPDAAEVPPVLDATGPEESPHAVASRAALAAIEEELAAVEHAEGFERAFGRYRQASADGLVPRRGLTPGFVTELAGAATRVLGAEAARADVLAARVNDATSVRDQASREIEAAEAEVARANDAVREANAALAAAEEKQKAELAARNDAVASLNALIERAEAARRSGSADLEAAAAAKREAELDPEIQRHEAAYRVAAAEAAAAEQRAADELDRARREQARARAAVDRENEAGEALRRAETELQQSRALFREIGRRLVAGLGFAGVRGDPEAVGDPARSRDERLAGLALLLQSGGALDADTAAAVERERDGGDPTIAAVAALVGRVPADIQTAGARAR